MWPRKLVTVLKSLIFTLFEIVTVKKSFYFLINLRDFLTVTILNKVNINDLQTVTSLCGHIKNDKKSFCIRILRNVSQTLNHP